MAPYLDVDKFIDEVHKTYPEVNIEVILYSGANTTTYLQRFLGTLDGKQWQKDYLSGKANVSDTPGMMESMAYIQKWKDIGMLDTNGSDSTNDEETRKDLLSEHLFRVRTISLVRASTGTGKLVWMNSI